MPSSLLRQNIMKEMDEILFSGKYPRVMHFTCYKLSYFQISVYTKRNAAPDENDKALEDVTGISSQGRYVEKSNFYFLPVLSERQKEKQPIADLTMPRVELLEGRWFTEDELERGDKKMVLCRDWMEEGKIYKPGDVIQLGTADYTVIGVCASTDNELKSNNRQENYLPFTTMVNAEEKDNHFFYPGGTFFDLLFEKRLTSQQLNQITENFLGKYAGQNGARMTIHCRLDYEKSYFLMSSIACFILILFISLLCLTNIYGMFRCLILQSLYRYMVYKICGIKKARLRLLMYCSVSLITLLSSALGIGLFFCVSPLLQAAGYTGQVPLFLFPALILLLLLVVCLSVTPIIRQVIRREPVDPTLWR